MIIVGIMFTIAFILYQIQVYRYIKTTENLLRIAKIKFKQDEKLINAMADDLTSDYHDRNWVKRYYISKINEETTEIMMRNSNCKGEKG